jgi:F0F1-type ATP synthase membrane subunit c/vacuolar-type H+-ATPase subunit K
LAVSAPQNCRCYPASLDQREGQKNENISILIAVICAATAGMAQDNPALTGVDSLAAKPSDFTGKTVAVAGIVERVSEAKNMFTLVDPSEADCADGCQRAMIVAQLGQGVTTLPKAMEPVVAIGKVDTSTPSVRVTVTELVSGKEAVDARLKHLSAK